MAKLTERIEAGLDQLEKKKREQSAEAAAKARAREEEKRQANLQRSENLRASIRFIRELGLNEMLSEINEKFLKKRGRIQKAEGNFSHTESVKVHIGGYDTSYIDYECHHMLSCIRLSWGKNELGVYFGGLESDTVACKVIGSDHCVRDKKEALGRTAAELTHSDRHPSLGRFGHNADPSEVREAVEAAVSEAFLQLMG